MRTTVTLDPDVAALLRKRMAEQGISFKQAVNDAIRAGLVPEQRRPDEMPVFHMGEPAAPLDKALRLAGDLEDEALLHKLDLRK